MKKLIFLAILAIILQLSAKNAFSQLSKGDGLLGGTVGLWSKADAPTFGVNYESQLTQLGDVATLSLGGIIRLTTFKDNYPSSNYYDYRYTTFGLQSNLNFNLIGDGKFVPFVGAVLGYNNISSTYVNRNGSVEVAKYDSGLWLWGQLGARYFFAPKVAGVVRLGAGNFDFNSVEIGIDFKL